MQIYDLRTYLELLAQRGQLMRIQQPVSLIHEAADVAATCERTGGPAPLFEHIYLPDDSGQPKPFTGWRLFASAVANQERVALALGCDKAQVTKVMAYALDPANAISPVQVRDAAWKRNLITDPRAIDVNTLPIPKHAVGDGGRFITGGVW
jgi:UbiD family decarboxylases